MASNKECVIVVLDVRQNSCLEFKQKAIKYTAELLKDKICAVRKDLVSFVLLGTERTFNDVNSNVHSDGYLNIVQYPELQCATWQMLINFFKFVNEPVCDKGDWLDALVVAMQHFKNNQYMKFSHRRIILFYDFNGNPHTYDDFDTITENLLKEEIGLTVISDNIKYIDNPVNGDPQAVFANDLKKNEFQLENEKFALRLVTNCNAKLLNCTEALNTIFKVENDRPWAWNCKLCIGSKICISVQGIIAVKDESNIKLKKCWGHSDEIVSREPKYFIKDSEVEATDINFIDGYMLGATPIPYDETILEEKITYDTGLKFLGFAKRTTIPAEYFCSDSLYWIIHRKEAPTSAKMLDALVKALLKTDMVILCWKVYSVKFNTPKLVVLLPNKLDADKPASLSMVELAYHAQHHFWDFPTLSSKKTECTKEQIEAIDDLIDSMDLSLIGQDPQTPRETIEKELLPFDLLPHIYERNIMDILERKVVFNADANDELFQDMLKDKNFVEVYWKVPETIEEKAKKASSVIKKLFPMEILPIPAKKINPSSKGTSELIYNKLSQLDFDHVRAKTPAEDFTQLLQCNVLPVQDNTLRYTTYNIYAEQMRDIIWKLLFNSQQIDYKKIAEALKIYKKSCFEFLAIDDYNKWIHRLKKSVIDNKLYGFWQDVIVNDELGICILYEPSLEEKLKVEQFYIVNDTDTDHEMNDTTVDDLISDLNF